MEFKGLSAEMKEEVEKIVVAFEASEAHSADSYSSPEGPVLRVALFSRGTVNIVKQPQLLTITIGSGDEEFHFGHGPMKTATWGGDQETRNLVRRALFRMGYDSEELDLILGPLSYHEKLELRLLMPREFWPQKWLDAEK